MEDLGFAEMAEGEFIEQSPLRNANSLGADKGGGTPKRLGVVYSVNLECWGEPETAWEVVRSASLTGDCHPILGGKPELHSCPGVGVGVVPTGLHKDVFLNSEVCLCV